MLCTYVAASSKGLAVCSPSFLSCEVHWSGSMHGKLIWLVTVAGGEVLETGQLVCVEERREKRVGIPTWKHLCTSRRKCHGKAEDTEQWHRKCGKFHVLRMLLEFPTA